MSDKTKIPANRNLSINAYLRQLADQHLPRYRFSGQSQEDWQKSRRELEPLVLESLGPSMPNVPLNPEILSEWRHNGLIKQRVVFDVAENLSVIAYVFRPENPSSRLPALLACHGHGPYGKDSVMGIVSEPAVAEHIAARRYDYGLQMAKAGFAVIAIDWRGFGERDDRRKPHWNDIAQGRDQCNVHSLLFGLFGMTLLGMNVHDGACAIDYLATLDFVDSNRIGVMGLSFGGTMATWMAIADKRVKAADVICYSDRFAAFGIRDANVCGSQVTPGLYSLCDVPDLHGLIAPKPLLIEIGLYDKVFDIDSALSCYRELEKIYAASGHASQLELDLFEGGHQWGSNKSVAFFERYL